MKTEEADLRGHADTTYLALIEHILTNGTAKTDRTGTGTISTFGYQMRFDTAKGFPLLTTKKVHLRSIIHELLWFLSGSTNIAYLNENEVTIWDEWADEDGSLGPVYGSQWRSWPTADGRSIDQIAHVIDQIKNNPDSRRLIVSAWNVGELDKMKLPPCHLLFQFYTRDATAMERINWGNKHGRLQKTNALRLDLVSGDEEDLHAHANASGLPKKILSLQLYQRSCDTFLGVPFNVASYALLLMLFAQATDCLPGELIWTGGDVHLYSNHVEQAKLQLARKDVIRPMPTMLINPSVKNIFDFKYEDFTLVGYDPHPSIKAPIAV